MKTNTYFFALLLSALLMSCPTKADERLAQPITIANWLGNAKAAYSLVHDDFCLEQTFGLYQHARKALKVRELSAAFGVITSACKTEHWQQLQTLLNEGHEVYNHAHSHVLASQANWSNDEQIKQPHQLIAKHLNGYQARFYAFTQDQATDHALQYLSQMPGYLGTRAVNYQNNVGVNQAQDSNDFAVKYDLYTTTGQWSIYGEGNNILKAHVDAAITQQAWAFRTAHGVGDTSWNSIPLEAYLTHLDYVATKVQMGQLWFASPSTVLAYRKAKRHCQLNFKPSTSTIQFQQCDLYNGGLTLLLPKSAAKFEQAKQGNNTLNISGDGNQQWLTVYSSAPIKLR